MRKVFLFSGLLILGLAGSQLLPALTWFAALHELVTVLTMLFLGFIMIHVGYEFEIDRARLRSYGLDALVAATAACLPWLFCALYFVFVMHPAGAGRTAQAWKDSLLAGLFAAPTSAGILFSMLAAAGLSATWLFRKARVLAIFDDLDTVLLLIPLKMLIVGVRWQLGVVVAIMAGLLWMAWQYMRRLHAPVTWKWVLGYAAGLTALFEGLHKASKLIDSSMPIHVEILLPAFALGCVLARPAGSDPHADDAREGHQEGPESASEQRAATVVSGVFMVLVGLSMPRIVVQDGAGWSVLALHTVALTVLGNLGKMFPFFCYRGETGWRERLALCLGMWPRGEVGAGVLVVALGYGIGGSMATAATLSLVLNLLLTGLFIVGAKRLLAAAKSAAAETAALAS
jgi:Kef-type K+ transport system membrane component KefB